MELAESVEILVRVRHMSECHVRVDGETDIRDIAVLDPPDQPILSCFCVDVEPSVLEVSRQWCRVGRVMEIDTFSSSALINTTHSPCNGEIH